MKNYVSKHGMNWSVTIPNKIRQAVCLACAFIGATALTSSAAVQFNGTNSYATIVNQSYLGGATVTNFTIEFWVKNRQPEVYAYLGGKAEFWKEWAIGLPPGGRVEFFHAWPNTYYGMVSTNGVIKANQWQHVAIVGQGILGSIYVDGVLVQQANNLYGQISFNAAPSGSAIAGIVFGFRDNATLPDDLWFQGDLADYRIWDIALSGSQVASVYANPPATNTSGLRHWIPFNEGTGSTFTDIISGLQGQLFNSVWSSSPYCSPHKATATVTLLNGLVNGANMLDYGCGYTNVPVVLIQGGGGFGATASAVVSDGKVVGINIINSGCCYTNTPRIVIASPPFVPTVSIAVSRVNVTQHVVLGRNYILESSLDLVNWTATGPQFTADSEDIVTEFIINQTGQYFRIRQVP